jgi:hypothetical protein
MKIAVHQPFFSEAYATRIVHEMSACLEKLNNESACSASAGEISCSGVLIGVHVRRKPFC